MTPNHTAAPSSARDIHDGGFLWVGYDVMRGYGLELGPHGLAVYMALSMHARKDGTCYPSYATLSGATGVSKRQVAREINRLEAFRLISRGRRMGPSGQASNLYTLLKVEAADGTRERQRVQQAVIPDVATEAVGARESLGLVPVSHAPHATGARTGMPGGHGGDARVAQEQDAVNNMYITTPGDAPRRPRAEGARGEHDKHELQQHASKTKNHHGQYQTHDSGVTIDPVTEAGFTRVNQGPDCCSVTGDTHGSSFTDADTTACADLLLVGQDTSVVPESSGNTTASDQASTPPDPMDDRSTPATRPKRHRDPWGPFKHAWRKSLGLPPTTSTWKLAQCCVAVMRDQGVDAGDAPAVWQQFVDGMHADQRWSYVRAHNSPEYLGRWLVDDRATPPRWTSWRDLA